MNDEGGVSASEWLEREFGPLTFGKALQSMRLCEEMSLKQLGDV